MIEKTIKTIILRAMATLHFILVVVMILDHPLSAMAYHHHDVPASAFAPSRGSYYNSTTTGSKEGTRRQEGKSGTKTVGGHHAIGGMDEKVEGCFNQFDAIVATAFTPDNRPLNNAICQGHCSDAGYALSATQGVQCLCGNEYPSIFHQVTMASCDYPCGTDKATCFLFTCCGSVVNNLYTVSFSHPVDVLLQLLRQIVFDYRYSSPTFRAKIESALGDRTGLELVRSSSSSSRASSQRRRLFLVAGDGCPPLWERHGDKCYHLQWAEPTSFDEARQQCWDKYSATLVTISSPQENEYVSQLQQGCTGWIGDGLPGGPTTPTLIHYHDINYGATKAAEEWGNDYPLLLTTAATLSCGAIDGQGSIVVVSCTEPLDAAICQRPGPNCIGRMTTTEEDPQQDESVWWTPSVGGNDCYAVLRPEGSKNGVTWEDYSRICRGVGSHLASVVGKEEQLHVASLLGPGGGAIGLFRPARGALYHRPVWTWDFYHRGEGLTHPLIVTGLWDDTEEKEAPPLPQVTDDDKHRCLVFVKSSRKWRLIDCHEKTHRNVVCEKKQLLCEPGWTSYGGSCYYYLDAYDISMVVQSSPAGMNWFEAQSLCWRHLSDLLSIESSEEAGFISKLEGRLTSKENTTAEEVYTAANDIAIPGAFVKGYFSDLLSSPSGKGEESGWSAPDHSHGMQCTVLNPWREWGRAECSLSSAVNCYVCQKHVVLPGSARLPLTSTTAVETWEILPASMHHPPSSYHNQPDECQGDCVAVTVSLDGMYLTCDADTHRLILLPPPSPTASHPSQAPPPMFYAHFADDPEGAFMLLQDLQGLGTVTVLLHDSVDEDDQESNLSCGERVRQQEMMVGPPGTSSSSPVKFLPTQMLQAFKERALRVAVVARSDDLVYQGFRECSMGLYDLSPSSASFACYPRGSDSSSPSVANDLVWLEQQALIFFDEARYLQPRMPLHNGRTRCENDHINNALVGCSFGYGQGLTWTRIITLDWGYTVGDDFVASFTPHFTFIPSINLPSKQQAAPAPSPTEVPTVLPPPPSPAGGPTPQGGEAGMMMEEPTAEEASNNVLTPGQLDIEASITSDFGVFFNNLYEVVFIAAAVETRNWQMTIPVPPRTAYSIQFWLQQMELNYRWRALLTARGA